MRMSKPYVQLYPAVIEQARQMDEAIAKSFTLKDFNRQMAEMGYRCSFDPKRKYWTIIGKGWKKPKRLYQLGENYTNERILERINENSYAVKFARFSEPTKERKVYRLNGSLSGTKKIGGLRGLYFHYCYRLGIPAERQKSKLCEAPLSAQGRLDEDGRYCQGNKAALPLSHRHRRAAFFLSRLSGK